MSQSLTLKCRTFFSDTVWLFKQTFRQHRVFKMIPSQKNMQARNFFYNQLGNTEKPIMGCNQN